MSVLLACRSARAYYDYDYLMGQHATLRFGILVGSRFCSHYDGKTVASTPSSSLLTEVQGVVSFHDYFSLYGFYGRSTLGLLTQQYGGGLKLPVYFFKQHQHAFIYVDTVSLIGDYMVYRYAPPSPPDYYPALGRAIRYGLAMNFRFNNPDIYLEAQFLVSGVAGNLFVVPFGGLGVAF